MTPPPTLTERKQRQARQRIVLAAEELFLERGFDAVSVADIAERAEVGRTTFFRHFGDKQEVVFAKDREMIDTIAAAGQAGDVAAPRDAAEAVRQLRPIVLDLCAQAAADPEACARHFRLVDEHPELRARDALKMQQIVATLTGLLVHRGCDEPTAVLASEVALACYRTARRLGDDPHTLTADADDAFSRVLSLGTTAEA